MNLLANVVNASTNQIEGFCVIKSVALKSNVKGSDYLDFTLCDAGGEISAKLWDYSPEQHGTYEPSTIVKVRATIVLWKDTEQLKIDRIRAAKEGDDVDMASFVACAPLDPEEMYEELYQCANAFEDNDLRMLTQYLLKEYRERLLIFPAALKLHHAMRGGLLYHTLTMLHAGAALVSVYKPIYPDLSQELVYAGVILHDIAKCAELTVTELGLATSYSTTGQLIGHINIGVALVERAAAELMIDHDTAELVQHILLSHHGVPEHGSPRSPMFPEADLVSQIDLIDSRLFEMYDALSETNVGEFSERQWALDNIQLYKHGHK
jgi:3'-5' exoribonuclease